MSKFIFHVKGELRTVVEAESWADVVDQYIEWCQLPRLEKTYFVQLHIEKLDVVDPSHDCGEDAVMWPDMPESKFSLNVAIPPLEPPCNYGMLHTWKIMHPYIGYELFKLSDEIKHLRRLHDYAIRVCRNCGCYEFETYREGIFDFKKIRSYRESDVASQVWVISEAYKPEKADLSYSDILENERQYLRDIENYEE